MRKLLFFLLTINYCCHASIEIDNYENNATQIPTRLSSPILTNVTGACWDQAEERYGVSSKLLYAIAKVESRLNPSVISKKNANGSYDIGLMQINSKWLSTLKKYHITEADLLQPCTNIMVGAWILSNNINKLGYNWNAVGAYNAKSAEKREIYAKKVHKTIIELGYNN